MMEGKSRGRMKRGRDAASALVELGESRTPRMTFAPVRHHASLLDFPGFLRLRSSPLFAPIRSRWGQVRYAHHHCIARAERATRQITGSNPQRGTSQKDETSGQVLHFVLPK